MQRLHDAGEYFSTEAMQERDPVLYDQYIGRYLKELGGMHPMHAARESNRVGRQVTDHP
jgi:hypothetical protein